MFCHSEDLDLNWFFTSNGVKSMLEAKGFSIVKTVSHVSQFSSTELQNMTPTVPESEFIRRIWIFRVIYCMKAQKSGIALLLD